MNNPHPQRGFVFLYIVLLLASALTALALAAGLSGAYAGNRLRTTEQGAIVRAAAHECGERVLMLLRTTPSLTGSNTLAIGPGSCAYTIAGSAPNKTVTLTATYASLYKRLTITTTAFDPSIVATWVETQ